MNAQVMGALAQANEVRVAMADVKKSLKDGSADPVEVIQMCQLPISVFDILTSLPYVGTTKAHTAMGVLNLHEKNVLGGDRRQGRQPITDSQRERLAEYVGWRFTGNARWELAA